MQRPGEADPVGDAGVLRPAGAQPVDEGRVARPADPTHDAVPRQVGEPGQRGEQHVVALVRRHRRDAEQLAARRGARCEVGGVDAGLGDVHAAGSQGVAARAASAGSTGSS